MYEINKLFYKKINKIDYINQALFFYYLIG